MPTLPQKPQAPRPARVLIVDDDASVRHLLRRFLEQDCGAVTDDASGGLQVLDRLRNKQYDLVLLDLQMPEMDGVETLAAIRRSARYGKQKVIILSGRHQERMVREVVALGVTDFIAKPLALNVLRSRLVPHLAGEGIVVAARPPADDPAQAAERPAAGLPAAPVGFAAPDGSEMPTATPPPFAATSGSEPEAAAGVSVAADASDERLARTLLDALPQAVWLMRRDGTALHLNRRALELIGRTTDTLAGMEWLALVHPDDADELLVRWEAATRSESTFIFEFRLRRPDGSYGWCRSEGLPVRGQVYADRWVGTWTDVDDLRRLHTSVARDTRVLDLVSDAVIICDVSGVVTYWGPAAERLLQWTAGEMVGRQFLERFPRRTATELAPRLDAVRGGTAWAGELEDFRKDGQRVWTSVRVVLHRHNGRPDSLIWIQQDLSGRRRVEEALRESEAKVQHLLAREKTRGGWLRRTETGAAASD